MKLLNLSVTAMTAVLCLHPSTAFTINSLISSDQVPHVHFESYLQAESHPMHQSETLLSSHSTRRFFTSTSVSILSSLVVGFSATERANALPTVTVLEFETILKDSGAFLNGFHSDGAVCKKHYLQLAAT